MFGIFISLSWRKPRPSKRSSTLLHEAQRTKTIPMLSHPKTSDSSLDHPTRKYHTPLLRLIVQLHALSLRPCSQSYLRLAIEAIHRQQHLARKFKLKPHAIAEWSVVFHRIRLHRHPPAFGSSKLVRESSKRARYFVSIRLIASRRSKPKEAPFVSRSSVQKGVARFQSDPYQQLNRWNL